MTQASPEKRRKVLIIDDDELVRETIRLALKHEGFDAATAEAPVMGDVVARQSKPDLILLDLYLPEMNGLDLLRKLKADPLTKAIPVVVFTGSSETIDIMSAIQSGAADYIAKPIDGRRLMEKIRQALKQPSKPDAR